ncbi:MAG TPA: lysophospholipid acyltransferase family protein [Longimicrobiales bacterium]|nr:lysophospholipid acyltransferase family protein [Longimicrobiales bacterium]
MMRTLVLALVVVPVTAYYVLRVFWGAVKGGPDLGCVCDWVPRKWAKILLRVAGVRVVLENEREIDRNRPQIIVANHVSWFDVLALAAYTPGRYLFVAKKEIRKVPLFGRAAEACGHIYIDRQDRQSALASLESAREKLGDEAPTVIMFPEGTRSETGELQPFKKGAFVLAIQAGADVVPVAIRGSRHVMPKHSLRVRPGTITVRFGRAIPAAEYPLERRDELIERSREALAALLQVPAQPAPREASPKSANPEGANPENANPTNPNP